MGLVDERLLADEQPEAMADRFPVEAQSERSVSPPSLRKPNSPDLSRRLRLLDSRNHRQPLVQTAGVSFKRSMQGINIALS